MAINLMVNGKNVQADNPEETLLNFLREDLDLTGTKDGCAKNQCGTCTVIVDGKGIHACSKKMKTLEGAQVLTIEGLADGDKLHPIQLAYLICQGYQCGFCTPGLIMATKVLLDHNPDPTDEEIKQGLKSNICRCTGYVQVIEAVHMAADMLNGKIPAELPQSRGWVGEKTIMKSGVDIVTGRKIFTDDYKLKNPLQGRLFFPEYPHAVLKSVDVSEALKQPGVACIATHKDIPGLKTLISDSKYPQQILAINKVKNIGDPIAVVYAETDEQARAAMKHIKVEYEPLKVINNADEGLAEKDVRVHDEFPNAYYNKHMTKGNVERAFAGADIILEHSFQTQMVEHGLMEPEIALAQWDEQGRMEVIGPGQNPTDMLMDIAAALAMPEEKVHLVVPRSGGSFGKREPVFCHVFAALGTYLTKRPVRVTMNRREIFIYTHKRHPIGMHYKIAATKEGKLTALKAVTHVDTGCYNALGDYVALVGCTQGTGPYEIPNVDIDSTAIFTNKPTAGCFRGFGSTQFAACMETLLDKLCEKTGINPFELRRINGFEPGKLTGAGQVVDTGVGFIGTIDACEEAYRETALPAVSGPGKKIGVGIASGCKNMANGTHWGDCAAAKLILQPDGKILLASSGIEEGQGHHTIAAQIAAETLGVNIDQIDVLTSADGDITPPGGKSTNASRMTFIGGNAVIKTASLFKDCLLAYVAERKKLNIDHLDLACEGIVGLAEQKDFTMSFAELGEFANNNGDVLEREYFYTAPLCNDPFDQTDNVEKEDREHRVNIGLCFGTMVAIVEVDCETGQVTVKKVFTANDMGRMINPELARGQMIGAVVMGMGYTLTENYIVKDGYDITQSLRQLGLPKITDTPDEIRALFVEVPHALGPFNAKGFGEMALNPVAPAILNAIYNATGVRINSLPVDAKKLAEAIKTGQDYNTL
jgi:CO/xanthine dehydrogenase Mo-binding subunit/aerobic-type carbon monoxide dehydrogenase small subunit (CoxS/CutS family)